jgi:hypothetical protein
VSERIKAVALAVEKAAECKATHLESVPVIETFRGQVVWEGVVEVFALTAHPKAKKAYGWSYREGEETKYTAVLELPPVESPITAVRASILAQNRRKK